MTIINQHRPTRRSNGSGSVKKIRKGLSIRRVDDYLRFMIFVVLIGMTYIWNSHYAEKQIKEMEVVEAEVKELKSEYLLRKATFSAGSRFSEVKAAADTLGLRSHREAPLLLTRTP